MRLIFPLNLIWQYLKISRQQLEARGSKCITGLLCNCSTFELEIWIPNDFPTKYSRYIYVYIDQTALYRPTPAGKLFSPPPPFPQPLLSTRIFFFWNIFAASWTPKSVWFQVWLVYKRPRIYLKYLYIYITFLCTVHIYTYVRIHRHVLYLEFQLL
jgi:hypothetical protein